MRIARIAVVTAVLAALPLGGATVQSAYAASDATVTCGDFMKMSSADQEAAFEQVKAAMPAKSLATPTTASSGDKSSQDASKPPMSAGQVVSACQAAQPTSTVMDAVMHAMSGTMTPAPSK